MDGSSDPLQDGKLGWQVPHRDADAVALACKEILQGDDRRCDGHWLREQVLTIFGQEAFQKRLKDEFLLSLQQPAKTRPSIAKLVILDFRRIAE